MSLELALAEFRLKVAEALATPDNLLAAPTYKSTLSLAASTIQISFPSVAIPLGCERSVAVQYPFIAPVGPCPTPALLAASTCQSVSPAALETMPRTSFTSESVGKTPVVPPLE